MVRLWDSDSLVVGSLYIAFITVPLYLVFAFNLFLDLERYNYDYIILLKFICLHISFN